MSKASLRILCANDVYKPEMFSAMKTFRKLYAGEGVTKCVLPGDFLGGSLFASKHTGDSMIDVVNAVGFDYITLGNHEFDFGEQRTMELMDKSTFPWLGSNIRHTKDGSLFHTTLDTDVFEVPTDGHRSIRVGVFGVCTQATPKLSHCTKDIFFEDAVAHSIRCTKFLRQEQVCDVVMALTHVSVTQDIDIAEAALAVGGIDVIIGGHDHSPHMSMHHHTLILKCGQDLDYLGILDMHLELSPLTDGSDSVALQHSFQLLATAVMTLETDPEIDAIIKHYNALSKEMDGHDITANDVVCMVQIPPSASEKTLGGDVYTDICDGGSPGNSGALSSLTASVRTRETAFPCLVADAMKWSVSQQLIHSPNTTAEVTKLDGQVPSLQKHFADFAILNGGFVRGNRLYPPGTVLTKADFKEEMPFPRKASLVQLEGREVVLVLEQMLATAHAPVGCFPHLSDGLKVTYDIKAEPFHRVKSVQVDVNSITRHRCAVTDQLPVPVPPVPAVYEDIILDKVYNCAVSDFYVEREGDGVDVFTDKHVLVRSHDVIGAIAAEYFSTVQYVHGIPAGRLIKV